jgi:hypothetical protein
MKHLVFYLGILLFACRSKEQVAGGPCSYKTSVYPAKVVRIEQIDSVKYDALFEVNHGPLTFYARYYEQNQAWFTKEQLLKDSIVVGAIFRYEEDRIVNGSCSPQIVRLVLEPYSARD